MSVSYRQGSKGRSTAGGVATVEWGSAIGRTAVLDCITIGGAVGVNYSTAGRAVRYWLAAGKAAKVKD